MLALAGFVVAAQRGQPATWEELMGGVNRAYHEVPAYSDVWELTRESQPLSGVRYARFIDGKKSLLRISLYDPTSPGKVPDPIVTSGANGKEVFTIAYKQKSYFSEPVQDQADDSGEPPDDKGSFRFAIGSYNITLRTNPVLVLTSIQQIDDTLSVATGEAINPATGNRIALRLTMLKSRWLPTDVEVNLTFAGGGKDVIKLHATNIFMNGKIPSRTFDFPRAETRGFLKKSKADVLKDMALSLTGG